MIINSMTIPENKVKANDLKGLSAEKDFKSSMIMRRRPKGIIIMDTYNNPFFPVKIVQYDTDAYDMKKIEDELSRDYGISKDILFLPWHFQMELEKMNYYPKTTRPLMYKSLIPGFEDYIVIMITGDTNSDIYSEKMYKSLCHFIINSLKYQPSWKIKSDEITLINIGEKFRVNQLINNLR